MKFLKLQNQLLVYFLIPMRVWRNKTRTEEEEYYLSTCHLWLTLLPSNLLLGIKKKCPRKYFFLEISSIFCFFSIYLIKNGRLNQIFQFFDNFFYYLYYWVLNFAILSLLSKIFKNTSWALKSFENQQELVV